MLSSICRLGISANNGDKVVSRTVLKSRSTLTSLVYFSDLSALLSVTTANIFCRILSVKVVASCVLPSVLFK